MRRQKMREEGGHLNGRNEKNFSLHKKLLKGKNEGKIECIIEMLITFGNLVDLFNSSQPCNHGSLSSVSPLFVHYFFPLSFLFDTFFLSLTLSLILSFSLTHFSMRGKESNSSPSSSSPSSQG